MVKSYTLKGEQNGKEDRFVAYMLPAQTPPDRDAGTVSTSRWTPAGLIAESLLICVAALSEVLPL